MSKFVYAALLLFSTLAVAQLPSSSPAALAETDDQQIHAALAAMDQAWNRHDMRAMTSYMTDDVQWVNVVGMIWRGKDEVFRAHEAFHKTIFKDRQVHPPESTDLRLIAPGVVVVTLVQPVDGYTSPSGRVEGPSRSVLTEVFVHRGSRWLLAEGHNTTLVEAAQRSNPIQH